MMGSTQAEGDPDDLLFTETVLQQVKDWLAMIPDDFIQPRRAVHRHKKGSLVQPGGLGVGNDLRIQRFIPHLDDLLVVLATFDVELGHQIGKQIRRGAMSNATGGFLGGQIHAPPQAQYPTPRIPVLGWRLGLKLAMWCGYDRHASND